MSRLELKVPPLLLGAALAFAIVALSRSVPGANVPFPGHRIVAVDILACRPAAPRTDLRYNDGTSRFNCIVEPSAVDRGAQEKNARAAEEGTLLDFICSLPGENRIVFRRHLPERAEQRKHLGALDSWRAAAKSQ